MKCKIIVTDGNPKNFDGDLTHLVVEVANMLDGNVKKITIEKSTDAE